MKEKAILLYMLIFIGLLFICFIPIVKAPIIINRPPQIVFLIDS